VHSSYFNTFKTEEERKFVTFVGRFPRFARLSFTSSFEGEDYKELVAWYWQGKSKELREKPVPSHSVRHNPTGHDTDRGKQRTPRETCP